MAVAQAVRPDRPSTRSTRGTTDTGERNRGTRNTNRGAARDRNVDKKVESLNDRRVRPSTRRVNTADRPAVQSPRRKASTRNGATGEPARPSTRKRASTRAGSGVTQAKTNHERVESTSSKSSNSRPSRTKALEERRETQRYVAPIQFFAVMFLVIVVSVFAFGLLRGDPVAQQPNRPSSNDQVEIIYEKEGTTSTNTGILRGH